MKKQKEIRKLCVLLCMVMLTLSLTTPVFAETLSILDAVSEDDESTETDEDSAEDTVYSLLRGSDLNYGTTMITEYATGTVNIYGSTQCNHSCDTVYLSLYLERKVNGTYSTYKYWKNFSASNATHISKSINVYVPTGYYYRVRGYHKTVNDGRTEGASTLTNAIKID